MKQLMKRVRRGYMYGKDVLRGVLHAFLIMPPAVYATAYLMQTFLGVPFLLVSESVALSGSRVLGALVFFLMVGCAEEAAFRYMIQDCLFRRVLKFPRIVRLLLASVLFGAAHLSNGYGPPFSIPQSVGAAFLGVYLGNAYEKKGLHYVILVHGLYDFFVTLVAMR